MARRIEYFEATYQQETPADGEPSSSYQRVIIEGALPNNANLQSDGAGTFEAQLSDGSQVSVEVDGNHITRSVSLDGSNYQLETPIEQADFSAALGTYESVRQELEPKKARSQQALSFLENPQYADATLADMQEGLLNILGQTLYNELGIRDATDKQAVIQMLHTNVGEYAQRLSEAKQAFEKALKTAVQQNRERYRAIDEQVKQTLRILKFSGLDSWDIDYLVAQIQSGFLVPDLGVPFNPQNVDPAKQNFGEPITETNSLPKFTEYVYRFVNKGATGNPEGKDADGNVIGFSLDAVIQNPNAQLKTQTEIRKMMEEGGVWSEATGFNRNAAMQNLKKANTN